jgi:hypothetical protein
LGSLGIAGITIAVVGTLTAATGVGLLATGEKVSSGADAEFAEIANYRPPGGVLLGVGLAAAVAGVALIAVDRSRARRESLTVIVPSGGSSAVGISLLRRF